MHESGTAQPPTDDDRAFDMTPVMALVKARGHKVGFIDAAGGYCYVVGEPIDVNGDPRHPVLIGPLDDAGVGSITDLYIGPDDDGEDAPYVLATRMTAEALADLIIERIPTGRERLAQL